MKDIFTYDIWCWLRDTFGFEAATAILYIGFAITLMIAIWYISRTIRNHYMEGVE